MGISYNDSSELPLDQLVRLYSLNKWSAANKPQDLHSALLHSHSLISAWDNDTLVGVGNAISDGHLVVYYPHLLVLPEYQRQGIGREIIARLKSRYLGFHQHMLVADRDAVEFYKRCGFLLAGETVPMWIYDGTDH
jgi:GNAT superfamily N-acetyltransferase